MENNSNVQINATFWSEDGVIKNIKEINQQCNKPMLAAPMYMATVNVNGETITLWINTTDKKLLCKTNKPLNIKPNDVDLGLSVQQVFTSPTRDPTGDADLIDVYIFHKGGKELELNKTNLEIKELAFSFHYEPVSPLDNYTFKKGDVLLLRGDDLFLNENRIKKLFDPNNYIFSWHYGFDPQFKEDSLVYVIFKSPSGEEITKARYPEKKVYVNISRNGFEISYGTVILTLPIFRIEEKIINYSIGGESTDAFGHKYNLLNLTFENNKNVSLLVNRSDIEKLKRVVNLEVNKTYKISYFANSYKLINISEE